MPVVDLEEVDKCKQLPLTKKVLLTKGLFLNMRFDFLPRLQSPFAFEGQTF
jgi:hypothetical protein